MTHLPVDHLVVLRAVDRRHCAKSHRKVYDKTLGADTIKTRQFNEAKHFTLEEIAVSGFDEMSAALNRVERDPCALVIRGAPLPGINRRRTLRRGKAKPRPDDTFTAAVRHWLPIDFDKIPAPPLTDVTIAPEDAIQYLIGLLPPEFHDVSCWWQLTSSMGLPGTDGLLSARLWYWAREPLSDAEATRWARFVNREKRIVDDSIYRVVQPIYTARPLFENMADPLERRSGIWRGLEDEVEVITPPPDQRDPKTVSDEGFEPGLGVAAYLALIGTTQHGFRRPILSAIASYIAKHGGKANCDPLKKAIREAIDAADPGGRTDDQIARYRSDEHLDDLIAWVREQHGDQPPRPREPQPAPAPLLLPTATRGEIHTAISQAIGSFFARCFTKSDPRERTNPPPRVLLSSATGSGKTELIGKRLPNRIVVDKAYRRPHRIIVAVPAHRLGKQLAERYRAMVENARLAPGEVTVEIYEGRGDPFDEGEPPRRDYLCHDLPAVKMAMLAGLGGTEISPAVCGSTKTDRKSGRQRAHCRFRESCAYFEQFARKPADILLVAHNFLFQPMMLPEPLMHNINAVIIEEDPSGHAIDTVELPVDTFGRQALCEHPVLRAKGKADSSATERLGELHDRIHDIVAGLVNGTPLGDAVRMAGLTEEECVEARELNRKRWVADAMAPGMPLAERIARAEACTHNPTLEKIDKALLVLEEIAQLSNSQPSQPGFDDNPLSGLEEGIWVDGANLVVPGLRPLAEWVAPLPVLIASATARYDQLAKIFPDLEHVEPPAPALPHQTVLWQKSDQEQAPRSRRLGAAGDARRQKRSGDHP